MFEKVKSNLEKKGYAVSVFATAKEAAEYLDSVIDGKSVGFGGSLTLQEMGLAERLEKHNTLLWHWKVPEGKTVADMRAAGNAAEIYISSVNGLAETGEIINIDGTCNRVAAIMHGHERVYLVVGKNKLAETEEDAIFRARHVAAPKNAQRLGRNTPCAQKADKCYNCKSEERICRALCVLWEKPMGMPMEVVLVEENLGY